MHPTADTGIVDALDEQAVDEYVDRVVEQAGSIDISFDRISFGDVQNSSADRVRTHCPAWATWPLSSPPTRLAR
jgi:hypothetical protein